MPDLAARLREAVERLPDGLRDHVFRVEGEALRLAEAHSIDAERLRIAVLAHDLARAETDARLLDLAPAHGVAVDDVERASPILLHGPIGARMLADDYGFDDAEVLAAIAAHTTGAPGMTAFQKALFIADKIEADKVARKPSLAEVKRLAALDLDAAMLCFLDLHLLEAVERRWLLHQRSVAARNEALAAAAR